MIDEHRLHYWLATYVPSYRHEASDFVVVAQIPLTYPHDLLQRRSRLSFPDYLPAYLVKNSTPDNDHLLISFTIGPNMNVDDSFIVE